MTGSPGLAEAALHAASGLDGCVAIVTESSEANLRWARNTLTTTGESRGRDITLVGFRETSEGMATATVSLSAPGIADLPPLADALAKALERAEPAEDSFPLITGSGGPAAQREDVANTDGSVFRALSRDLGDLFAAALVDGTELFGYAEHSVQATWLASSAGVRLQHVQPQGRLEITAKSHGRTRSAWWGMATDTFDDVDLEAARRELSRSLDWQARTLEIPPGRHRTILTPGAVGDLMVDLWWSATAREAVEGRSVFSGTGPAGTRLGEQLSSLPLDLVSDPADEVIPASPFLVSAASSDHSSAFDSGAALRRTEWIKDGRLTSLMASRRFAADHDLPFVASPDTVRLEAGGSGDVADLVAGLDDGLVITCLWYNRVVDPQTLLLTGLTRDGVLVVRGGEVVGATGNFRFNDSPVGLLARIEGAGATRRTLPREMGDYAPRVAMPPLLLADFHLSTRSEAR